MSHPPQADNYSVSDGVRWRVGCGTTGKEEGLGWVGGGGAAQWFITTALNAHSSSATCPLQPPASSLAACPRVTRWHWLFFHALQLHASPIRPWAAPLLHNNTPATDWQEERRTSAAIRHKSFARWQLPPNVDCFLVIFKPLVSLSVFMATYVERITDTGNTNEYIYTAMQHLLSTVIEVLCNSTYCSVLTLLLERLPCIRKQNKGVALMSIVSEMWYVIKSWPSYQIGHLLPQRFHSCSPMTIMNSFNFCSPVQQSNPKLSSTEERAGPTSYNSTWDNWVFIQHPAIC